MKRRSISKSLTGAGAHECNDPTQPQVAGSTRQMVIDATPQIIQALINKAKDGSYLHARMLFEFAGLTGVSEPSERESPLVAILMKELGLSIVPDAEGTRQETELLPRELASAASTVAKRGLKLQSSIADEPSRRDATKAT